MRCLLMAASCALMAAGTMAKASEACLLQADFQPFYEQSIRARILEIEQNPNATAAERALRQYLHSELNKRPQGIN